QDGKTMGSGASASAATAADLGTTFTGASLTGRVDSGLLDLVVFQLHRHGPAEDAQFDADLSGGFEDLLDLSLQVLEDALRHTHATADLQVRRPGRRAVRPRGKHEAGREARRVIVFRVLELRAVQPGGRQVRAAQVGVGKVGLAQRGVAEVDALEAADATE